MEGEALHGGAHKVFLRALDVLTGGICNPEKPVPTSTPSTLPVPMHFLPVSHFLHLHLVGGFFFVFNP